MGKLKDFKLGFVLPLLLIFVSATEALDSVKALPTVGTKEAIAQVDGINIEVVVQSPSAQETALQVICLFEYTEGDIFTSPPALSKELNGLVHVDEALHGLITEIRKTNMFKGKFLETLLIVPPKDTIPAKRLLLIGLGNRNDFKPEIMQMIGVVGMRMALNLGVSEYSHASDLKDAGIASPTGTVTGDVIKGALDAYRTQAYLKKQNASNPLNVTKISLLSGPAFFDDSKEGIKDAIKSFSN